jgi:hypothetical protein
MEIRIGFRTPPTPALAYRRTQEVESADLPGRGAFDSLSHLLPFRIRTGHVASSRMLGEKTRSSL